MNGNEAVCTNHKREDFGDDQASRDATRRRTGALLPRRRVPSLNAVMILLRRYIRGSFGCWVIARRGLCC
jgi:hypothetical protein